MRERPYELVTRPNGFAVRIRARGNAVLTNPMLNRGTAFTDGERRRLGLTGLLPCVVSTMEAQLRLPALGQDSSSTSGNEVATRHDEVVPPVRGTSRTSSLGPACSHIIVQPIMVMAFLRAARARA